MLNLKLSTAAVSAMADAFAALLDNGYFRIYDDGPTAVGQPATCNSVITDQRLLAEGRFGTPAFPGAVAGVLAAVALPEDLVANATGTPSFFRAFKADGVTPVVDGSCGTGLTDAVINTSAIQVGQVVSVTSLVLTVPKE